MDTPPALALFLCYLLGTIPFGLLWTRILGRPDPRTGGSGNIGATNVLRTGGRLAGALTLLCDAAKGSAAAALAGPWGMAAAFIGHVFPVWLRFRGGKGVAVFFGGMCALSPWLGAALAGVWLLAYRLSRRSSVGALSAAAAALPLSYLYAPAVFPAIVPTSAMIFYTHRTNIARLRAGTEPRTDNKKSR